MGGGENGWREVKASYGDTWGGGLAASCSDLRVVVISRCAWGLCMYREADCVLASNMNMVYYKW